MVPSGHNNTPKVVRPGTTPERSSQRHGLRLGPCHPYVVTFAGDNSHSVVVDAADPDDACRRGRALLEDDLSTRPLRATRATR